MCLLQAAHKSLLVSYSRSSIQQTASNLSQQRAHVQWLDEIRRKIWHRAKSLAHELSSADALCLHWRQCVWINHL